MLQFSELMATGNITPGRLLETLKVLLSKSGGIKSHDELPRIIAVMEKFNKKLVCKSIYLNVLQASTEGLLKAFLTKKGWTLLESWMSNAISSRNLCLVLRLVRFLSSCPPPKSDVLKQAFMKYLSSLSDTIQSNDYCQELLSLVDEIIIRFISYSLELRYT